MFYVMGKRNWLLLCRDESPKHASDYSLPSNVHVGHFVHIIMVCVIMRVSGVCDLETVF